MGAGSLTLRLTQVVTAIRAGHDVAPSQYEPGVTDELQAARHELDILFYQAQLVANLQLMERLQIGLEVPFRTTGVEATFTNSVGEELSQFSSIHHRDEWIVGIADPVLRFGTQILQPGDWGRSFLLVHAGLGIPLGNTEPDPFRLGVEGIEHQHMFFGFGTITPRMGLRWSVQFDSWALGGWSNGQWGLFSNSYGYTPPSNVQGGVGVQSSLGLERLWFGLEPRFYAESPARWESRRAENSGRTDFSLSGMTGFQFNSSWSLSADISVAVARIETRGDQLEMPWIGSLNLMWKGSLWSE